MAHTMAQTFLNLISQSGRAVGILLIPSPASLIALVIETSGDGAVIEAWGPSQQQVMAAQVKD